MNPPRHRNGSDGTLSEMARSMAIHRWRKAHPAWETAKEAAFRLQTGIGNVHYWGAVGHIPAKRFNKRVVFYYVPTIPHFTRHDRKPIP